MKRREFYRLYSSHSGSGHSGSGNYNQIGLVASLVLHALLVLLLFGTRAPQMPPVTSIEVTIEPPTKAAQRPQIVSPSNAAPQPPPENTTRLSDTDSRTDIEKVLRGDGGGVPGQPNKAQKPAQVKNQEQHHPAPKRELQLKDLKLDDSTLALKFGEAPKKRDSADNPTQAANAPTKSLSDYQAFSRPPGSGAAFFGSAGINDHLPNLPDGDITLLNAKANVYASFVRRVAIQVFTQLRSQGWERLSAQEIRQMSGFATVEAVLKLNGSFVRAQIVESSGSNAFDSVLYTAASRGTADPNPPPGAVAKDGNIHFIFKARSWTQIGVNRRSGAPVEQRWLLLATGLED
jgi:TonB family protein